MPGDELGRVEISVTVAGETLLLASETFVAIDVLNGGDLPPEKLCVPLRAAYLDAVKRAEHTVSLYGFQGLLEAAKEQAATT